MKRFRIRVVYKTAIVSIIVLIFALGIVLPIELHYRKNSQVTLKRIYELYYQASLCQRELYFGLRTEQLINIDRPYVFAVPTVTLLVVGSTSHAHIENIKFTFNKYDEPTLEVEIIGDGKQYMIPLDPMRAETKIDLDYGFW